MCDSLLLVRTCSGYKQSQEKRLPVSRVPLWPWLPPPRGEEAHGTALVGLYASLPREAQCHAVAVHSGRHSPVLLPWVSLLPSQLLCTVKT